MTFGIIKSIDIISPSDGKRYSSTREYEKSLHAKGQDVMSDKTFREMRERLYDERNAPPPKNSDHNYVHIDLRNGKVETSKQDLG